MHPGHYSFEIGRRTGNGYDFQRCQKEGESYSTAKIEHTARKSAESIGAYIEPIQPSLRNTPCT
jgi:hypothetical protein